MTRAAVLAMIISIDPLMKNTGPRRWRPRLWMILSCIAFLFLIWTALRFINAIQEMGGP